MPDRDGEIANARLDTHEAVCAERHKATNQALNDIKAMILTQGTDFHLRLNTISNRMFMIIISCLGGTVVALVSVIFWLVTKGHQG